MMELVEFLDVYMYKLVEKYLNMDVKAQIT